MLALRRNGERSNASIRCGAKARLNFHHVASVCPKSCSQGRLKLSSVSRIVRTVNAHWCFSGPSQSEGLSIVSEDEIKQVSEAVDAVYRSESRQVLATLIRLLGDFDAAEEALHDAFAVAVERWPRDGVPANPRAWLVSTGRFKAIDGMRRRARFDASLAGTGQATGT